MSEFSQATKIWQGKLGLHLGKNPAGTFSFSGSVPIELMYSGKDEDIQLVIKYGMMGNLRQKVQVKTWENVNDAISEAKRIGVELCNSEKCSCRQYFNN